MTGRCETVENIHEVMGRPCPKRYHKESTASYPSNKIPVLQVLIFLSYFFRSSFSLPISVIFLPLHLLSDGFFVFGSAHPLPHMPVKESLTAPSI